MCPSCVHYAAPSSASPFYPSLSYPCLPRFFSESYSQLFHFSSRHVAQTLSACARLKWRPPREWMDRVFLETYGGLELWKLQELAAVLNALGR